MAPPRTDPVARFLSKIERTDSCWEWRGGRATTGYGVFWVDGRQSLAHRFSYRHFVGEIPGGLFVLHACDNPGCVNPGHLHLGTQRDNLRERTERGRAAANQGTANAHSRLTEADIRSIRADPRTLPAIGAEYGVDFTTISKIKRRVRWRHVT